MTRQISVTLPDELVASARQAVTDGRASSVSAYIAAALAERQDYEDLATLLADMEAEAGGPTPEDRRWGPYRPRTRLMPGVTLDTGALLAIE